MKISGAHAVCRVLQEQGVEYIFGYPGGANLPLYEALRTAKVKHVLTVHEQGAAHAADGYARASGNVGVCLATSGPGATNLVTGLAAAYLDSSPVVAITGQVPTSQVGRDAFQEVDTTGVTMPVTKHNFLITKPDKLVSTLRNAFFIARSGRPGPVLVDIPRDILMANVEYTAIPQLELPPRAACAPDILEQAVKKIVAAKKPVIIAGGGAVAAGASREMRRMTELLCVPVVHTLMGKGAFADADWHNVGLTGMHGKKLANKVVHNADLIIAVGCRFSDRVTNDRERYSRGKTFIHIDIDPAELDKNINGIGLSGDLTANLNSLIRLLERELTKSDACADIRQHDNCCRMHSWWQEINDVLSNDRQPRQESILPEVINEINELTKGEKWIFVTDVGQHQIWAAQYLNVYETRSWLTSGGLGAMGFGLPAALGASLAKPERRVCIIAGDGGFKMTGTELYTIAALNLPIIVIVVENGWLGMVKQLQKAFFKGEYFGTQLTPNVDFTLFAAAFGVKAETTASPTEFNAAFKRAVDSNSPRLIVVNDPKGGWVRPMLEVGASLDEYIDI